jgi:hypothetical protein
MKRILKFGWALLFSAVISTLSLAQSTQNLVAGVGPVTNSIAIWNDKSAINLVSGNALFPASGNQIVPYIGITQGATVDVGNMVAYITKRNNTKILSVIPVTYRGRSSGSILLNVSNCRVVPPSTQFPCVLRLDPLKVSPSPLYDCYFVIYFSDTVNNVAVDSPISLNSRTTIIGGINAGDQTRLRPGNFIPSSFLNKGSSNFLVGVMNN